MPRASSRCFGGWSERSRRGLLVSLVQNLRAPEQYKLLLDRIWPAATRRGLPDEGTGLRPAGRHSVRPRAHAQPVQPPLELTATMSKLPLAERVTRLRDPQFRARLLAEDGQRAGQLICTNMRGAKASLISDPPDYEQPASQSVAALAKARGIAPENSAQSPAHQRRPLHAVPAFPRLRERQPQMRATRCSRTNAVPRRARVNGQLDHNISHWNRDRTRGAKLPLATMVRMRTLRYGARRTIRIAACWRPATAPT